MSSARIPTHVRVLLLPLVTMISASAACSSTADPPASDASPARQRSSALWNGHDDADDPVSNAVVALDSACTGYAVTSQLVLTSAHCVVPSNQSNVGLVKVGQRVLVGANLALANARVARPDAASPSRAR